jgi:hypothetical protein
MHAELLSELVGLGRLGCAPDLLQASDVWLDVLEDGQDPTAVLTPGITQAPPQVPRHRPQGVGLSTPGTSTSSGVASCSQAVCLRAITVGGAEHRIGQTQLRMAGGREVRGDAGVQLVDDAGKGSTIADAVMPYAEQKHEPVEDRTMLY